MIGCKQKKTLKKNFNLLCTKNDKILEKFQQTQTNDKYCTTELLSLTTASVQTSETLLEPSYSSLSSAQD
jgi:hypothetical protein